MKLVKNLGFAILLTTTALASNLSQADTTIKIEKSGNDKEMTTQIETKEYGIVLLPDEKYSKESEQMFQKAVTMIPDLTADRPNVYHVTLYHAVLSPEMAKEIAGKIQALNFKPFDLEFETHLSQAGNQYLLWDSKIPVELVSMHKKVLETASPYHVGPLKRCVDGYPALPEKFKKQIDQYGVYGVLDDYSPHITLFHGNSKSENVAQAMSKIMPNQGNLKMRAKKIAIGELGYRGNLLNVTYTIDLK